MEFSKIKKVNISNIEFLETLGLGLYGKIRLAKNTENNEIIIVKILNKSEVIRLKQVDHVYSELCILSEVNHPFIIEMKGFSQDQINLYFLQEYLSGGDMYNLLCIQSYIPFKQAKFYAAQISLVFQDLKPENLVLNLNGYMKLIDFGLAKKIEGKTYTMCGTPNYMAPEIINNKGHSFPVDWWTLGILLYELTVGIDPFHDEDTFIVYQKIIKGKMKFPKIYDKDAKSFIKHLLVADVNRRFGCLNNAKEIFDHRWLKSIDLNMLLSYELSPPYIPEENKCFHDSDDLSDSLPCPKKLPKYDPFMNW